MARLPRGALVMSPWQLHPERIMGGGAITTAAAGKLPHIVLYNNTNQGYYLYVIGCEVSTSNNAAIWFEAGAGNFGMTPYGGGIALASPILAGNPVGPGVVGTVDSAACLTNHIGGSGNSQVTNFSWKHSWPMAILPPNFSFLIEGQATASTILGGLWWFWDKYQLQGAPNSGTMSA